MIFSIPARGLMGYRGELMTDTKGNGIMNHLFDGYAPYKGDIDQRNRGSLSGARTGRIHGTTGCLTRRSADGCSSAPGVSVYEGMVVGENAKERRHRGERMQVKSTCPTCARPDRMTRSG